jgi:hypothetical protein
MAGPFSALGQNRYRPTTRPVVIDSGANVIYVPASSFAHRS